MNPETKLILDELHRRFTDHDLKWDQRFEDQEKRLGRQIKDLEQAQDARVSALEKAAASFDEWRSSNEGGEEDLTRLGACQHRPSERQVRCVRGISRSDSAFVR